MGGINGIGYGYDYGGSYNTGIGRTFPGEEDTKGKIPGKEEEEDNVGKVGDERKAPGRKSSPADCETCKNRKYQDGSDENDVSFQTAAHIDPAAAGAKVRAHEQEHVVNAYEKAEKNGGKVLSVGVSIHTAVCPECGRVYVAGGETKTTISTPKDDGRKNPYDKQKEAIGGMLNTGIRSNYEV